MKKSILVVGVGGQGVISLGKVISVASKLSGYNVIGCEEKGDAQRGGKTSSLIRIYRDEKENSVSTRLGSAQLDLLLSLDLIETARYFSFCSPKTVLVSNLHTIIPPLARNEENESIPLNEIKKTVKEKFVSSYLEDFSLISQKFSGNKINTNIIELCWALKQGVLFDIEKDELLEAIRIIMKPDCFRVAEQYLK